MERVNRRFNFSGGPRVWALVAFLACFRVTAEAAVVENFGPLAAPASKSFGNTVPHGDFTDDYSFSIAASSSFDALAATIDLGNFYSIGGLDAKLYAANQSAPVAVGTSAAIPGGGTAGVIAPMTLYVGGYTIELRGTGTGTNGGSYSGVVNLSPTLDVTALPESQTGVLLLAGLAMLGVIAFRRNAGL